MIISQAIGEYGRWQLLLTFLLSLVNIPCTWHIFSPTFHARPLDTWCARAANFTDVDVDTWRHTTQPQDYCTVYQAQDLEMDAEGALSVKPGAELVACTEWEFGNDGSTIISEFKLLCDRKVLNNVAEMMFLGGVAVGGLASGVISDRYGRKKTLVGSVFIQTMLGVLIAFNPIFELYCVLRAALGFISVSVVFSGFVLSIEMVGGIWRTVAGISYLFPVSLSYALIAGIAYFLREWRQLQLAISLPGALILSYWWIMPESPRWLLALGRTQEVIKILQKAARFNGKELPKTIDKQLLPTGASLIAGESASKVSVLDLFRTRHLRKITLCMFVIWFSVYLVYYGVTLNIGNIGGDLYLNSVLSGLVEVPAIVISIVVLLKLGRKWPLALTLSFAGCACALVVPILFALRDVQWLITTFVMSSKFLISSSNAIMPVFTAELYPTTIRNIGVGASNVSAGVALMLVPYLWELESFHESVPLGILGIFGLIGGVTVLLLPETGSDPLKDTITSDEEQAK